jgi:glycosyltransferase involved in cell wall biosynthesis
MNPPLVSVLMPVSNAERYVAEAVESILTQSFGDFEFLVIDDGSKDDSLSILNHFAGQDPRIRVVSRPNTGIVRALNELLDMSRGELIARMDADDISLPMRLESQVDYLRAHPSCLAVGGRVLVVDPEGEALCEWCREQTHEEIDSKNISEGGFVLCHPSVMMRREAVIKVGKYRERFYAAEDLDLFLHLAEHGRLANLPQIVLKYRMHTSSISHTQRARQVESVRGAIMDAYVRRGLNDAPKLAAGRGEEPSLARLYERWGWWALMAGNVSTARKYAKARLRRVPLSISSWRLLYCAIRGY